MLGHYEKFRLERNLNNALGDGLLTGATPEMQIDEYSMSVTYNPDSRVESLESYYADAIESGKIKLEDIPALLARNGLMPVADFINMRVRLLPDARQGFGGRYKRGLARGLV